MNLPNNCAICRVSMLKRQALKVNPCNHLFHVVCAQNVINLPDAICPVCRSNFTGDEVVERKVYKQYAAQDRERIVVPTGKRIGSNHSQTISHLELEILKKVKETDELKTEIERLKRKQLIKEESNLSFKFNEMVELTNENELLKQNYDSLEQAFENLRIQHFASEETLQEYKNQIAELRESLQVKREELLEKSGLHGKLQEELFLANKELEIYKNKPLETGSKGNSLFAEVDDRRVYLQKTVNDMKSMYMTLKRDHSKHEKVISHLRKENADLRATWKKDLEEIQEDQNGIVESLNNRIKILEEINERQKLRLEEQMKPFDDDICAEYQFYQDIIDSKSSEIMKLERKLSDWTITNHMLSSSLAQANKELKGTRLTVLELKQIIEENKEKELFMKEAELLIGGATGIKEMPDTNIEQPVETSVRPLTSSLKSIENTQKERLGTERTHQTFHAIGDSLKDERLINVKCERIVEDEGCSKYPNTCSDEKKTSNDSSGQTKKKGVKFDEEIPSPPSNPVRRRGTKLFIIKKDNVISVNSNVEDQR